MTSEKMEEERVLSIGDETNTFNPYLNARTFNIHRTSDTPEVSSAIDVLCEIFDKNTKKFKAHLRVLVCDLYFNWKGCKNRYLSVGLANDRGQHKLIRRYNRFEIGYRLLKESIVFLYEHGYISFKRGYQRQGFDNGFQTRIRATDKLISFLEEEHHITEQMIFVYPDQELIIRKDSEKKKILTKNRKGEIIKLKVKIKRLDPYTDTNHTRRWRNTLERYNQLIADTYIDLDLADYKTTKRRKRPLFIDLSRKVTRRIFSNGNFESGGRFYGGFWQSVPGDMRPYLLIDGEHVVEHDFSGMHIHILYAMIGKRLADTGLLPYKVSKDNDPEQKRPYYKKLLLTAVNASSKWGCVQAVKDDMKANPEDYPDGDYNLWEMLDEIVAYHPSLEGFLLSEEGLHSQYVDSSIAYRVIKEMTDRRIPVLCIHDSFISAEKHADELLDCMKSAYVDELNLLLKRRKHELRLTINDAITDETSIIQRGHSITDMMSSINTLKPLEIILRKRNTSDKKYQHKKPLYKLANRGTLTHLYRFDVNIDPHQKTRQKIWFLSNKNITNFNETIVVNMTRTIKNTNGTNEVIVSVSNSV